MLKKEILWREILNQAVENKKIEFTQKELARKFGISTSTVFNALKIPRAQGAILVSGRNFRVADIEKFLYIWATQRNLEKEIIFKTFTPKNAKETEGLMPSGIIFSCYSAYSQKYRDTPADYDKVYVYADKEKLEEIKKRFPKAKGNPNIFVLKKDSFSASYGDLTPDVQTFVDLWNLKDWYAKDFLNKLKEKIIK
ncbi:MAG: hypothetical protein COU46_01850 [Candidatus Niyogibacteria bacterium CG10_big_fil_rev_8_21_14_0_10_42_19]|uniref:Uncharacterized protein n=1 Tax=Candidatus Niyogibacteria bacterium CG10_big_fil_rev_8_21_14_0_10_42_19 TaxID=1974725 RepID=A0A2H0TFN6_9BACT|nr:MAG: hypothetical protein COU46_01850 [Candidatus Niyogibacteria bacterium CG10_big_fil_rev_8_21_14_0_10_42_19]